MCTPLNWKKRVDIFGRVIALIVTNVRGRMKHWNFWAAYEIECQHCMMFLLVVLSICLSGHE